MVARRTLSAEEFARDVECFAADDHNLLAFQKLLCDCAGKATEQVTLAVNNNLYHDCVSYCVPWPASPAGLL